jgi:very-short-patch-repair endonuclease
MRRGSLSEERQHDYFRMLCRLAAQQCRSGVEFEYRFHPARRWRFDAAFPARKVAIELDGGVFAAGRHTRGAGFIKDCEKINEAQVLGWRVFRFTPQQMESGEMSSFLERALGISD